MQITWDEPDLLNVTHVSPWSVELVTDMPAIPPAFSPFDHKSQSPLSIAQANMQDGVHNNSTTQKNDMSENVSNLTSHQNIEENDKIDLELRLSRLPKQVMTECSRSHPTCGFVIILFLCVNFSLCFLFSG